MLKAFHIIGMDAADLFRLKDGHITEGEIIQKGRGLFEEIMQEGVLRSSAMREQEGHSRQFHLDRLVRDDQYVYLSIGKRYWNDPESVNFGFIFDAQQLLRQGAILRKRDLLSDYGDLLDEVVKEFVPNRREDEFSEAEVARLMASLEDPESDYVSPNDSYYTLMGAVEHQRLDVLQTKEATEEFLKRAQLLQQSVQATGDDAVKMALEEEETGRFELLVRDCIPLASCTSVVYQGQEFSYFEQNLLTTGQASKLLGVSVRQVQFLVGRFENASFIGRDWLLPKKEVYRMAMTERPRGRRPSSTKPDLGIRTS